jgi:hypothetical protein
MDSLHHVANGDADLHVAVKALEGGCEPGLLEYLLT